MDYNKLRKVKKSRTTQQLKPRVAKLNRSKWETRRRTTAIRSSQPFCEVKRDANPLNFQTQTILAAEDGIWGVWDWNREIHPVSAEGWASDTEMYFTYLILSVCLVTIGYKWSADVTRSYMQQQSLSVYRKVHSYNSQVQTKKSERVPPCQIWLKSMVG